MFALGVDFTLPYCRHVQPQGYDTQDAWNLHPCEFCSVEAQESAHESRVYRENVVPNYLLDPVTDHHPDHDAQEGPSEGNPDEIGQHLDCRGRVALRQIHEQHKKHHRSPIIHQRLPLDQRVKPHARSQLLQQRNHCHWVSRWKHASDDKCLVPTELFVWVGKDNFKTNPYQNCTPKHSRTCQDQNIDQRLAKYMPVTIKSLITSKLPD